MCGIIGIYSKNRLVNYQLIFEGLRNLQHRGIQSAGLAYYNDKNKKVTKILGLGKVADALPDPSELNDDFFAGVGHVRYATSRKENHIDNEQSRINQLNQTQAFISEQHNIAFVHNGHIIGAESIAKHFGLEEPFATDSEFIFKLVLKQYEQLGNIESALIWLMENITGVYSIVMLHKNKIYAVRDSVGIRPLWIGRQISDYSNYIIVSETAALPKDYQPYVEVHAGEIIKLDKKGLNYVFKTVGQEKFCSFERIYFQSHKSYGIENFRFKSGKILAEMEWKKYNDAPLADFVVCMPNTAIPSARGFAKEMGIPYYDYIKKIKDYRSFIAADQKTREIYCQRKFEVDPVLADKDIYLVDDSIVRGTTMIKILKKLRELGVNKIHVRSVSPLVKYTCQYGIDIPTRDELVGSYREIDEICEVIGADTLEYLSITDLKFLLGKTACTHCFDGQKPFMEDW